MSAHNITNSSFNSYKVRRYLWKKKKKILVNTFHKWYFRNTSLKMQLKIQAARELQGVQECTFKVL